MPPTGRVKVIKFTLFLAAIGQTLNLIIKLSMVWWRGTFLIFLLSYKVFADCEDQNNSMQHCSQFASEVTEIASKLPLKQFRPEWIIQGSSRWYRNSFGILVHQGCFSNPAGMNEKLTPKDYDEGLEQMLKGAIRCHTNRGMIEVYHLLLTAVASEAKVTCDANGCPSGAGACSSKKKHSINFPYPASGTSATAWFHELLHLAGADNQTTSEHNKIENNIKDDVWFWQRLCFMPKEILDGLRHGSKGACREPLETNSITNRFHYDATGINRICKKVEYYSKYIESSYIDQLNLTVTSELFACDASTMPTCPNVEKLNGQLKAAGLEKMIFPQIPDPPSPKSSKKVIEGYLEKSKQTISDWVKNVCYFFDSQLLDSNLPAYVKTCVEKLRIDPEIRAKLKDYNKDLESAFIDYLNNIDKRATFVVDGFGRYEYFADIASANQSDSFIKKSTKECEQGNLSKTNLCKKFNSTFMEQMTRMIKYWE